MRKPVLKVSDSGNVVLRERENESFKNIYESECARYEAMLKTKEGRKAIERTALEDQQREEERLSILKKAEEEAQQKAITEAKEKEEAEAKEREIQKAIYLENKKREKESLEKLAEEEKNREEEKAKFIAEAEAEAELKKIVGSAESKKNLLTKVKDFIISGDNQNPNSESQVN